MYKKTFNFRIKKIDLYKTVYILFKPYFNKMQTYLNEVQNFDTDIEQLKKTLAEKQQQKTNYMKTNDDATKIYSNITILKKCKNVHKICNCCNKVGIDYVLKIKGYLDWWDHNRVFDYYQDIKIYCCLKCFDDKKIKTVYDQRSDYTYPCVHNDRSKSFE